MTRFAVGRFLRDIPLGVQILLVVGTVLLAFALIQFGLPTLNMAGPDESTTMPVEAGSSLATPATSTVLPTTTQPPTAAATPLATRIVPTSTLLPPQGGIIYALKPYADRVGWVASGSNENYFGESFLYTGISKGRLYHGAFQFDLSFLPPGSSIHYAAIELTGLDEQRLGQEGTWSLQMLGIEIDPDWSEHGFKQIHESPVVATLAPILNVSDLGENKTNVFVLNAQQRAELERRIFRGVVSFRLDGPTLGEENLFSWDTGYGPDSKGKGPILRVAIAPPIITVTPEEQRISGLGTPTPTYVVVTSEPTPQNMLTVAAQALTATAFATMVGTPTPLPPNWVTPVVVTLTPTPQNEATALARSALATAVAVLTGTPTPTPGNVWTATPTPTFIIITSMPTPKNTLTAVAVALTATAQATTVGTPTPLPPNWVTPIIITPTPLPGNRTTATAQALEATVVAVFTGTPTPTPPNVWTATPTSTLIPTATPTSTWTPTPLPETPTPTSPPPSGPSRPKPTPKPKPPPPPG
jgi:hypothetical protein